MTENAYMAVLPAERHSPWAACFIIIIVVFFVVILYIVAGFIC